MDAESLVFFLVPVLAVAMLVESLVAKLFLKKDVYHLPELLTSVSLGLISSTVAILFTAFHLSVYNFILSEWSLFSLQSSFVTFFLAFIVYDFFYYWGHFSHHKISFLWANHVVHHSGVDFNFSLAVRIGFLGTFTVWVFFLPMAIVGVPVEVYGAIISLQVIYQYLLHTTLIPELGFIEKLFVTPSQHRVHHAKNSMYLDKNFGCFLVVWDRMFGTYQKEEKDIQIVYGASKPKDTFVAEEINFSIYIDIVRNFFTYKGLSKKIRVVFGSPYNISPKKNNLPEMNRSFDKTWFYKLYGVLSYIPSLMLCLCLLLSIEDMPLGLSIICLVVVMFSFSVNGVFLQRGFSLSWLEIFRYVICFACLSYFFIEYDQAYYISFSAIIFLVLSIGLIFLRKRLNLDSV